MANAAAAVASPPGLVTVRTALTEGKVVLRVEDSGPAVDPDLLPQLFEPLVAAREGPNPLELAACKTLTQRRLQGSIHAENRAEGGVALVVALKPWG
jgi:C4-dicarboxylate-specific signal transduction histidine kinase